MTWREESSTFNVQAELPVLIETLPEAWTLYSIDGFPAFDMLTIPSGEDLMVISRRVYLAAASLFAWSQGSNDAWKAEFWGSRQLPVEIKTGDQTSMSADLVVFYGSNGADYYVLLYDIDDQAFAHVQRFASCASHLVSCSSENTIEENLVSAVEVSRAAAAEQK